MVLMIISWFQNNNLPVKQLQFLSVYRTKIGPLFDPDKFIFTVAMEGILTG